MSIGAQLARDYQREAAIKFTRAVDRTTAALDKRAPVKTGKLKRSRRVRITTTGSRFSATVDYTARAPGGFDYGEGLDEGLKPHTISAKPGGVLRFMGRDGKIVYRKKVFWKPRSGKHLAVAGPVLRPRAKGLPAAVSPKLIPMSEMPRMISIRPSARQRWQPSSSSSMNPETIVAPSSCSRISAGEDIFTSARPS